MPRSPVTDQQRRAIDAQGVSVVLSSGAGCGKTSVLTERYLKHLADDGAEVGQIVAITFTERAAREMRDRIRGAIQDRLKNAAGAAAARWKLHLRNLESAAISTIHSFCGNVLRQHALAAGLDPRFEVLDEVLAGNLRAESLRNCLHDLLPDKAHPAGADLRQLVVDFGWYEAVQAIRRLAFDPDPLAWKTWLARAPEEIERQWLGEARQRLLPGFVDYLIAVEPKIAACLSLLAVTPCTGPETRSNVARILKETPALAAARDLAAAVGELKECAKVGKERAKAWNNDDDVYALVKDTFEDYRKAIVEKLAPFTAQPESLVPAIRAGQRFIRVALEVVDEYQRRKERAAYLDFQDLLVMARDLVRDNEPVRQALRERYRFILVDEMQDTDPVQMELVLSLCTPIEVESGKLFAVGDHKQSIYRFRGAEVRLFQELRERVPEHGRLNLTRNFRSQQPILDFVNALCSRRVSHYEPLDGAGGGASAEPCVEFLWSLPPARGGKPAVSEVRRREAGQIAERLRRLFDDAQPRIWDKQEKQLRAVRMQDVAILFRSMSNVAIYEEALRRAGIDYYLVGGRAFFAQQEVYDLYRLLRALENPDDSLSLAGALRSPFCCVSDEALFILSMNRRGQLWKGLHDDKALKELPAGQKDAVLRARVNLERWRGLKDRLPIVRLIGEIFADSGYDAAMQFEFLGDRKLANLWKLQDLARTFDRSGNFGLADFVQRLGELVRDQPREEQAATLPEKADVVKLMSIHQAKGLEFPVVVIPDLAAATRSGHWAAAHWDRELGCVVRPPEDFDPPPFPDFGARLGDMYDAIADWAEDLRILYVACTRAEDLLILSAGFMEPLPPTTNPNLPLPLKGANTWMMTLAERFNLRSGECIAADVPAEKQPRIRVELTEGFRAASSGPSTRDRGREPLAPPASKRSAPRSSLPALLMLPTLEWMSLHGRQGDRLGLHLLDADQPEQFQRIYQSEVERLFDEILCFWDLRNPDDWESTLAQCVADEDTLEAEAAADLLAEWLRTFTASELYREVTQAEDVMSRVEFLLKGPDLFLPPCRGWIDLLMRDRAGVCRLVAFHSDKDIPLKTAAKLRGPFLALQAEAFWQQTGIRCHEADLFDLEKGTNVHIKVGKADDGWRIVAELLAPLRL
jgi:ATP-dependent helicase/nuclease subunit A